MEHIDDHLTKWKCLGNIEIQQLYDKYQLTYRKDPRKFPIHGVLKNILRKRLDFQVFVDQWPECCTVIAKPTESKNNQYYRVVVYSTNPETLQQMLCHKDFLPKDTVIRIYGLPMDLIPAGEQLAISAKLSVKWISKEDPRRIVLAPVVFLLTEVEIESLKSDFQTFIKKLPQGLYFDDLDPKRDIHSIINLWKDQNYSDFFENVEEARSAITYYLTFGGVSVGIFQKSDKKLVTFILPDVDNSLRMGIVDPAYRGKELFQSAAGEAWRKLLLDGDFYWGYVAVKNSSSIADLKKRGSYFYEELDFVHVVLRALEKSKL